MYHLPFPETVFYDEHLCHNTQRVGHLTQTQTQDSGILFTIFPNPTNNILTIKYIDAFDNHTISLYHLSGREILKRKLPNGVTDYSFSVQNLEMGIYLLKIQKGENVVWNSKVAVIK